MAEYLRGRTFWSRIMREGKAYMRSTGVKIPKGIAVPKKGEEPGLAFKKLKEKASLIDADFAKQLDSGAVFETKKKHIVPLVHFEPEFFTYLESHVSNPRTREFYKQAWKPLTRSLGYGAIGGLPLNKITIEKVQNWIAHRSKEVSPARVNASLRTLRRALKVAEERGRLDRAPRIKLIPGEKRREYVITEGVLAKMLVNEKCTPLLKNLIPFLIDTGLRITEAISLLWEDVNLEGVGSVFVKKGKTKFARRTVPLTKRAKEILVKIKAPVKKDEKINDVDQLFVFPASDGTMLNRHWPSEQFRTLRDAMGLPDDCVIHSCRHTFCTNLGERGFSAFEIQKLAGHGSVVISERYVHMGDHILENMAKRMDGRI